MTPKQFAELLDYIKENNSWGDKMYEVCCVRNRRSVKYVDAVFDSRDGTVWHITFRSSTCGENKVFRVENENDIKKVYEYLDEKVE